LLSSVASTSCGLQRQHATDSYRHQKIKHVKV